MARRLRPNILHALIGPRNHDCLCELSKEKIGYNQQCVHRFIGKWRDFFPRWIRSIFRSGLSSPFNGSWSGGGNRGRSRPRIRDLSNRHFIIAIWSRILWTDIFSRSVDVWNRFRLFDGGAISIRG